jgi:hypothetical protein
MTNWLIFAAIMIIIMLILPYVSDYLNELDHEDKK